jgi:acetyl/propionyl-CoA carboxylase alpha subunit
MIDVMRHPDFVAGKTYTSFIEKNMSDRQLDMDSYKEIAVAIATVASTAPAVSQKSAERGIKGAPPPPWEMIGSWQIGDSIRE